MTNPWDDLEPETPRVDRVSTEHAATRPPKGPGGMTVLLRGATKRCPRCGSGNLFRSWFRIRERCPRCGLRLEREEGGFLGAMTINYVVTAGVWVVLLVAWLVVDLPDLHVAALTIASLAVAGLFPLLFWPFSKTIWASVDYLIYRTSPDYGSREAADHAGGNGGRH
jgi:uncharacterized protein (DUF983 family)